MIASWVSAACTRSATVPVARGLAASRLLLRMRTVTRATLVLALELMVSCWCCLSLELAFGCCVRLPRASAWRRQWDGAIYRVNLFLDLVHVVLSQFPTHRTDAQDIHFKLLLLLPRGG